MKAPLAGRARDTERRIRNSERKISCRGCAVAGCSYRQNPHSGLGLVNREQRAALQGRTVRSQCAQHDGAEMLRRHVLRAHLNDAGATILAVGQQDAEIEVVGKNHAPVVARPLHDFGIGSVAGTNRRPMNRLESVVVQKPLPLGRQVHVDDQSHATARGTSSSSTRQAA